MKSAWYTDLMMGNFFRVTCPYLFELDTVAYFPLIWGRHSFDAVARIRDTTQLLLDVCSAGRYVYLHPLKVWNRYSDRMFLPHCFDTRTGAFSTVRDGVGTSRYYQALQRMEAANQGQNYDSYDRFFSAARMEYAQAGDLSAETELPGDMEAHSEPHDSWYIGSDVDYTYIVSAVWNNEKTPVYRPEALNDLPDLFQTICPDAPALAGMIQAVETPGLRLWQDAVSGRAVCGWE